MRNYLFYIISILFCCLSCNRTEKISSSQSPKEQQIEQAVRNSKLFENSDLSDFKDFEEVKIDYKELPSYKLTLDDIKSSKELIEEAREKKDGDEAYIEYCLQRIQSGKNRIQYLKEKTTSVMHRVKFKEDIKVNGKHFLTTYAQAYLNKNYEVIDFIH